MDTARRARQSRAHLDVRLKDIGPANRFTPPVRGWIKAIREALGMSTAQLAARLGVKQPSVVAFEQSEARGTIELTTLRRVAEALDCTVVYALIPKTSLEHAVRERAHHLQRTRLNSVEQSMRLEDQEVPENDDQGAALDELVRETNPRLFWD